MVLNAEPPGLFARVCNAHVAGVARGHEHRLHFTGAQGVHGDGQGERRVHAAGQAHHGAVKTVFVHIIADTEHDGLVGAGHRRRCCGALGTERLRGAGSGDGELRASDGLAKKRQPLGHRAGGVHHKRAAVENQFVLPADQVYICHRDLRRAGAAAD